MAVKSLFSRPADLVYFIYFVTHIPATLLLDVQAILPEAWMPEAMRSLGLKYIKMTNDPVVGGAMGHNGNPDQFVWLRSFSYLELFFQLPIFILGARALWKNSQSFHLPLILYGASTATTTLACLAVLLRTPLNSTAVPEGVVTLTPEQRNLLLASYLPYFVIPLAIALDFSFRVSVLMNRGLQASRDNKTK